MLALHRNRADAAAASDAAGRRDLGRRLRRLGRLFDLPAICAEPLGASRVQAYYRECHEAYRRHHAPDGGAHMALNPGGRFDVTGFLEQTRRLAAGWAARPPRDVLELGYGQGNNLAWLAPRLPGTTFHGVDLTPEHHAIASRTLLDEARLPNVRLQLGDLHHLPLADASIDEMFAIEVFCYADDPARAFAEAMRVLRPGGGFTIFDAYQTRPSTELDADAALAVQLVARGVALERWQVPDEVLGHARAAGFTVEAAIDLDAEVMPNVRRLDRLIGAVIRVPWLARRALARRAPERGRNVLTGYLLLPGMNLGLLCYRHLVLRKAG